jgi:predicted membrane channel-forming protein YqfA (hemolysin III family)
VYESWAGLAANMAAAALAAQLGTHDIWALSPDFQRNRAHMVLFVGCVSLCYWAPMGVQAWRDAAAWLAVPAAAAPAPPALAAAWYAAATLATLLGGGAVFAAGLPERLLPGVFDIVGFSHQQMHLAAIAAHALEYAFVMEMWSRRRAGAQLA